MTLFELVGKISVDNKEANESIAETGEKAESTGNRLSSGIAKATKWGTAIVGGATVAVGGLVKFAESSASTADNIDKMSQKIGISREAYQELDFICSQSGTSVDSLQAGMKTLTSAMDGAVNGTANNIEQFERLGVSVANSDGTFRSQEDVMWETMEALQNMSDQTEKARLATELFGKSGTELMPLLNGASGSIDEMKQQAHDLGLVMNDEMIDNGVNMTDAMDQMKRSISAIVTKLGGSLMPIVEKACDFITANLPKIQAIIDGIQPVITQLFEQLLPPLLQLAEQLLPPIIALLTSLMPIITQIITTALPIITQLLQMLLPPIVQIVEMILPILVSLLEPLLPLLEPILTLLQPFIDLLLMILEPLVELINIILPPLIDLFVMLIQNIIPHLKNAFGGIAEILSGAFKNAFEFIKPIIESAKTMLSGFTKFIEGIFAGDWKKAWEGISELFSGVWNGIWNTIKGIINLIIGGINNLWSGIYSAVSGIVNSIGGIADAIGSVFGQEEWGFSMPSEPPLIPLLEKGGIVDSATPFIAGENGKEAVIPLERNTQWLTDISDRISQNIGSKANDNNVEIKINIKNFINNTDKSIDEIVEMVDRKIAERINRKRVVIG